MVRWDEPVVMIMSQPPVTVSPSTRLEDVARVMYDNRVGSVIVVDEAGVPVGIFTKTDLVYTVASGIHRRNPAIGDIMRSEPVIVKSTERISDAYRRMNMLGISHLPVVDSETGKLIGMVSVKDILAYACGIKD